MSARDKIQKTAPKLCWGPGDKVTPEQLGDLANAMDANFDALLDDLDPLPEPDKFDLEPSDFGDIEEDGQGVYCPCQHAHGDFWNGCRPAWNWDCRAD